MDLDPVDLYEFLPLESQGNMFSTPMLVLDEFDFDARTELLLSLDDEDELPELYDFVPTQLVVAPKRVSGVEIFQPDATIRVSGGDVVVTTDDQIVLPVNVVLAYLANDMFLRSARPTGYEVMLDLGVVPFIQIPHVNNHKTDGQLKILVDFFIGVDACAFRHPTRFRVATDPMRILVIGSASESGINGISYAILQYLDFYFEVDMWDPYEVEGGKTLPHVVYRRHRGLWKYDNDLSKYDIVFDDAFVVRRKNRETLDPNRSVLKANDFSIKWLKHEDDNYFNGVACYHQAINTEALERRGVKYPRVYHSFHNTFAGVCALCVELKYQLLCSYSPRVYNFVLYSHKKCCVPGVNVVSRAVSMAHECCSRNKSATVPYAQLYCGHHTKIKLYRVNHLSSQRKLYTLPKDLVENDYRSIVARDVLVTSSRVNGVPTVRADFVVTAIAVNIVIRVDEYYLVTIVYADEKNCVCNDIVDWVYDVR
jgi:hypothetical protein